MLEAVENLNKEDWDWTPDVPALSGLTSRFKSTLDDSMALGRKLGVSKKPQQCSWIGCTYNSYLDTDLAVHLDNHATQALIDWTPPSSCTWQGCKSKSIFKRQSQYKKHLKNIHTTPLVCTVLKCKHKSPFRNQADLLRHKSTSHSDIRPYICPFENCSDETKTFARKDKWLQHIRETPHEGDVFCPYWHCDQRIGPNSTGFRTRKEISNHFSREHSVYESKSHACCLGGCSLNIVSEHWTIEKLRWHLRGHHAMDGCSSFFMANKARLENTAFILRSEYLQPGRFMWRDCTICTPPQIQQPQWGVQMDQMVFQPVAVETVHNEFVNERTY
jgi:hypothetical protein